MPHVAPTCPPSPRSLALPPACRSWSPRSFTIWWRVQRRASQQRRETLHDRLMGVGDTA